MAWPMLGSLVLGCTALSCTAAGSPSGGTALRGGESTGCTAEALEQCVSQSVDGVDVFDGQGAIDWAAVADSGVHFAMIKATQGTDDTQETFAANWSGARDAGVRRGAYHFFDPTDDGAAQARRFLAAVGPLAPGDLPPMLDIECPDGDSDCLGTGASGSAPAAAIAQRMWDWIDDVEAATATRPIVYTFATYFESNGIDTSGLDAYPLFLAQPARVPPASAACVTVPDPWSKATMWQYSWSGRVPGIGPTVDLDRFLGSPDDLQALAIGPLAGAWGAAQPGSGPVDAGSPDTPDTGEGVAQPAGVGAILAGTPGERAEAGPPPGSPGCL
jgi:lysozyme